MPDELISWLRSEAARLAQDPTQDAGYALPRASLKLLETLVRRQGMQRVFEFGSGHSTQMFLSLGCHLVSLEDSSDWLAETRKNLGATRNWHIELVPLTRRWDQRVPFRSWAMNDELLAELAAAELVLIDSPAHPPSREMALLDTLRSGCQGLVVLDDAGIPTVSRFCERLLRKNPALAGAQLELDHGLFVLDLRQRPLALDLTRGLLESLKAWRRYLSAVRYP